MSGSTLDKIEKMQVILRNMKSDIKRQDRLNSINRMGYSGGKGARYE